jgi:hypothetical protein
MSQFRPIFISLSLTTVALTGCGSNCLDDGFAWQQGEDCNVASATDSDATTDGATTTTDGTTTTAGGTESSTSAGSGSESDSSTTAVDPTATGSTTDNTTNPTTTGPDTDSDSNTNTNTDSDSDSDTAVEPGPCDGGKYWTNDADWDEGALNNLNHLDPNNDQLQITLDGVSAPMPYMFLAQTDEGIILKLDTITGKQLGRYLSTLTSYCANCAVGPGAYPSRIIVDFDGDAYIANRAFGGQGSLSKLAGQLSSCVDRNKNGMIETTKDTNNDGIIDIDDPTEYYGQADECLLWTIPVGAVDALPRALTLDGKGFAYVGTYSTQKAYKIDIKASPAAIVKEVDLPSTPYGFSLWGNYLYSSALGAPVMRMDLGDDSIVTMNAPGNYGIAVDQNGIAWFGGQGLQRCDFDMGGDCQQFGDASMNGTAVDSFGQIWASANGTVFKFANDGTVLGSVQVSNSYGVAIGHDNDPRVIGFSAAFRVAAGAVGQPPGAVTTYSTAHKSGSEPFNYTYTDFTGFGAQNISITKGEWTVSHDSGEDATPWTKLIFNQEPEGKVPAGTSITFQVRAADTEDGLALQPWVDVEDGAPVQPVVGRYVEIRARLLITDEMLDESPVLSDLCIM